MVVNGEVFERCLLKLDETAHKNLENNEITETRASMDDCEAFRRMAFCFAAFILSQGPSSVEEYMRAGITAGFVAGVEYARLSQELAETEGR
jgi:hypothetical protein